MNIRVKITKTSKINTSVKIKDDLIISKKGQIYLIKEDSNLLELNPELIIFQEIDKTTSYILNYIKSYDIDFYNKINFFN